MAKSIGKKTARRSKWFWFGWIIVVVCAVGVAAAVIWKYENDKAVAADRVRFEQADQDVTVIANQIAELIGGPIKNTHRSWCSSPSTEWHDVPLGCNTTSTMFFSVANAQEATDINRKVVHFLNTKWQIMTSKTSKNGVSMQGFTDLDAKNYVKLTSYQTVDTNYLNSSLGIKCGLTNTFYPSSVPPFNEFIGSTASVDTLAVTLGCQDKAKVAVYSLE